MSARFELKKARNGKFYFNLLAANGEVILTSQMYASKSTAKKGVASVQVNSQDKSQFEEKTNKKGEYYFILKAKNHQVIGTGEAYAGKTSMKKGIVAVSKNTAKASIVDMCWRLIK